MKKRKFNILLNIAVLCMCVCAIAIGVYSAKTASLNVSGTIGFTAHNCKVNISAYMYGHSLTADGTPVAKPTSDSEKQYLVYGTSNTKATESAPLVINGDSESLSFNINTDSTYKGVYFSDMGESGDLEPIRIVITITNLSSYEVLVDANVTVPESSKCDFACDNALQVLYTTNDGTKSKTATLTYILFPKIADAKYTEITTPEDLGLSISFSKLNTQISSEGFTFDDETNPTTITGVPASDGTSDVLVIPSTFTDLPGKTITTIRATSSPSSAIDTTSFTKLVILDGVSAIGTFAFYNYNQTKGGKLEKVSLPNSLTSLGMDCFCSQKNLISCYVPKSVNTIGSEIFNDTSIKYLFINNNISAISSVFAGYSKLKFIDFDNGINTLQKQCFANTLLYSVILPNSVKTLSDECFSKCTNLTSITLPNGLTNLSSDVFSGSTNLHTIIYKGTIAQWNAISKVSLSGYEWDSGMNGYTIYCTDGNITKS